VFTHPMHEVFNKFHVLTRVRKNDYKIILIH
jgi:hypothetical protein